MYATVFQIAVGNLKPAIPISLVERGTHDAADVAGATGFKFSMAKIKDDGTRDTPKINGANVTLTSLDPPIVTYQWAGLDTDTAGQYASWVDVAFGTGFTQVQTFDGPVIEVYAKGDKVAR
jgi:hypothetical protein